MDYGEGYVARTMPYPASAYPWLSFAQVGYPSIAARFRANGVKAILYTFASQVVGGTHPQTPFWTDLGARVGETNPTAATFLHDCSGHALAGSTEGNFSWYFLDWSDPATVAAYKASYVSGAAASAFDYWFIDGS